MTCPEPRQCLGGHGWSRLPGWHQAGKPDQYYAECPACRHPSHTLSVGIDKHGRVAWYCHADCPPAEVRAALARAGIHDRCLARVRGQRTEDELVANLTAILEAPAPAQNRLLAVAAAVWNRGRLPRGRDLEALGRRLGLSRSTVYRATSPISGINAGDIARIAVPHLGQPIPHVTHPSQSSDLRKDREFGASPASGVGHYGREASTALAPPRTSPASPASLSPRRCEWCEHEIPAYRRTGARFCGRPCQEKAARARKARAGPPPGGSIAARERRRADDA
jgi:hypothetical protein